MAISTIKNPHVPGSVLAESTGNKTYAEHILAIYPYYKALTTKERQMTAIVFGDNIYRNFITSDNAGFTRINGDLSTNNLSIGVLRANNTNASLTEWTINTSNVSKTGSGSDSYNGTVQLVYGI